MSANLQQAIGLVQQHSSLLGQMRSLIEPAGRELQGSELLRFEQLSTKAKSVHAQLAKIDRLAARAAAWEASRIGAVGGQVIPQRVITAATPVHRRVPLATPTQRRPVSPLGRLAQDLQFGIRYDLDRKPRVVPPSSPNKVIRGYGVLFNTVAYPRERETPFLLLPGACDLAGNILFCRNHDATRPFASTQAGSLRCWQDQYGLAIEATVDNSRSGRDLLGAIASGTHSGLSVYIGAGRRSAQETIHGQRVEVISRTRLLEISAVANPGCPGAACWLASMSSSDLPASIRALTHHWSGAHL